MPTTKQFAAASKRLRATAQKYASLEMQFQKQVKRYQATKTRKKPKHVSHGLVNRLQNAKAAWEKAAEHYKQLHKGVQFSNYRDY